jgi:hypothetical protein
MGFSTWVRILSRNLSDGECEKRDFAGSVIKTGEQLGLPNSSWPAPTNGKSDLHLLSSGLSGDAVFNNFGPVKELG